MAEGPVPRALGDGAPEGPRGVTLALGPAPEVRRIAFWPDRYAAAAARLCAELRAPLPAPGRITEAAAGRLARIAPLVLWRLDAPAEEAIFVPPEDGAAAEVGPGLARLSLRGPDAAALLARAVSLDLRPDAFGRDAIAQTAWRHASVTLMRADDGFDLLLPLSFAEDALTVLQKHAVQFD
ncbi:MAG: hypothetical protein AAF192_11380 [Pseudomonadota bacterium]